jgi:cytochrome c peroxidase
MKLTFIRYGIASLLIAVLSGCQSQEQNTGLQTAQTLAELGQRLYFDVNLSKNRTQSCASCHDPASGFVDPAHTADSIGDDGTSHGGRNAPTASYASFSPNFHRDREGRYIGGQFHDGRASNLAQQALGPPLNPAEMGMPSKQAVVDRLRESDYYRESFTRLFDTRILENVDRAYEAVGTSIQAFEETEFFSPFDSKYDRYLRGEYEMTTEEELGRTLFFSQQFTNCNQCHQLRQSPISPTETFTDYSYHNIGVPRNPDLERAQDLGLAANESVQDEAQAGKFKVPTLRNVAVTAPYMHNGVFSDLRTVVLFYDHYNSRNPARAINPETGQPWSSPEVDRNLSEQELTSAPALDNRRVDALVAFMKTLTDQRYEHLLDK